MQKRLIWADSIRGILILLVVLGHAIQKTLGDGYEANHLWNAIYSFHMAAFMAVSGYLAFRPCGREGSSIFYLLFRRFRQLIVPFVIWTAILLITNNRLTTDAILNSILYPDKGGLWFLWVLFFINVLFLLCSLFANRIKVKKEFVVLFVCLTLIGIMTVLDIRVFGFQFIAYYFVFYSVGYYLHKYDRTLLTNNTYLIASLTFIWAVMAYFWNMHKLPYFLTILPMPAMLTQYAYRFFTALVAIYVIICISPRFLNVESTWNKPLTKMGIVSLGIYTTHFIILGYIVSWFASIVSSETVVICLSFIMGALVSWLIVWLLSKWKFTAMWFLGKI